MLSSTTVALNFDPLKQWSEIDVIVLENIENKPLCGNDKFFAKSKKKESFSESCHFFGIVHLDVEELFDLDMS